MANDEVKEVKKALAEEAQKKDGWKLTHNNKPGLGRKKGSKNTLHKARTRFTPALKRRFLKLIAEGYDRTSASALCGISRHTMYSTLRRCPKFAEDMEIATEMGNSQWEKEAINRIKNGSKTVERDADGNIIKTTTKDNDALLLRMLESKKGDTYGKKQTNVNIDQSDGGGAIQKLASLLGVTVEDKKDEPIDITDADYEEKY